MTTYSYMPTVECRGQSHVLDRESDDYWIDSDRRFLTFRNQYGERFMLVSMKLARASWLAGVALGIVVGRLL